MPRQLCQLANPDLKHRIDDAEQRLDAVCRAAKALLENDVYGDSVDAADDHGWTPLQTAAEFGALRLVKMLLDRGASVDLSDRKGLSPLHWAAQVGDGEWDGCGMVASCWGR